MLAQPMEYAYLVHTRSQLLHLVAMLWCDTCSKAKLSRVGLPLTLSCWFIGLCLLVQKLAGSFSCLLPGTSYRAVCCRLTYRCVE